MSRPRSDIAQRIRHAAREQFLLHGVDGSSLRAIAAEAGTNIGMVYYYFPNKDDLFIAVVEDVYARLLADIAAALDVGAAGPRARAQAGSRIAAQLQRMYARVWTMSDEEYAIVRLVMREAMVSAQRVQRLAPLFANGHIPLLMQALHDGQQEGALDGALVPVALLMSTVALGLMPALAWRVAGRNVMPDFPLPQPGELGRIFSSILLGGIGAGGAQPGGAKRKGKSAAVARKSRSKKTRPRG